MKNFQNHLENVKRLLTKLEAANTKPERQAFYNKVISMLESMSEAEVKHFDNFFQYDNIHDENAYEHFKTMLENYRATAAPQQEELKLVEVIEASITNPTALHGRNEFCNEKVQAFYNDFFDAQIAATEHEDETGDSRCNFLRAMGYEYERKERNRLIIMKGYKTELFIDRKAEKAKMNIYA